MAQVLQLQIRTKIGLWLMLLAVIFVFAETIYFGCYWHPQSTAESICDYISGLVFLIGFFLAFYIKLRIKE